MNAVVPQTTTEADIVSQRRALIDLVAETRSRIVRVALFGSLLHRSDPDGVETDEERASSLRVLLDTVRWVERVATILKDGRDPWNNVRPELCAWLVGFVDGSPGITGRLVGMSELSRRVGRAAEHEPCDLGPALRAHYAFQRDGFMDDVTEFCDGIRASVDAQRAMAIAQASEAGTTIVATLKRLENIGKHVRLVSLNASIEASRIGEAAQGIGVLAREFKTLSEEIQALSATASENITRIIDT